MLGEEGVGNLDKETKDGCVCKRGVQSPRKRMEEQRDERGWGRSLREHQL